MVAKNYTLKEAVEIIAEGKDLEAIADLGKRFPILSIKIARLTAKAEKEIIDFMQYMPEHLTIKKVNNAVKTARLTAKAEAEDATEAENKPVKEETAKEVEEPEEKENKPVEPKKRGRKPKAKVKAVPVEEPKAEVEDDEDDWDIEDEPKEVKNPKKSAFIEEDEDESWYI
jgi:hypothetical protein